MVQRCALAGSSCWGPDPDYARYIIPFLLQREPSPSLRCYINHSPVPGYLRQCGETTRAVVLEAANQPVMRLADPSHWGQIASLGLAVMYNAVTICWLNFRLRDAVPVPLCHSPAVEGENETSTRAAYAYSPTPVVISFQLPIRESGFAVIEHTRVGDAFTGSA